jgi:hypothetical protein
MHLLSPRAREEHDDDEDRRAHIDKHEANGEPSEMARRD